MSRRWSGTLNSLMSASDMKRDKVVKPLAMCPPGLAVVEPGLSQVMPFPWAASLPIVREYQQFMLKAGQEEFTYSTVEGYVAAKAFVDGVRCTQSGLEREKFIAAFEKMDDVDVGGFFVSFSPKNHNASKIVDLTIIARDGKFLG